MDEAATVSYGDIDADVRDEFADVLTDSQLDTAKYIDGFEVSKGERGKGFGLAALEREVVKADKGGYVLLTQAYPVDGDDDVGPDFDEAQEKLAKNFYGKAGFIHVGGGWCYRLPSKINESVLTRTADTVYAFRFLRLLTTPWTKLKAFKLGIIDKHGKVLKKQSDLATDDEKSCYNLFHRLVFNIKRLLNKLPFGKTTIASYVTALWLLKEQTGMSEDAIRNALKESGVEFSTELNESFDALSGTVRLNKDLAFPLTGQELALRGSSCTIIEHTSSIFSIPVYRARHETGQTIYVTPYDV
jgi:hypothetical protein